MCKEINLKKIFLNVLLVSMVLPFNFGIFAQSNLPVLELNNPVEEEIETGNSKSYSVRLEKNKYARFLSKQIGINSFIKIYNPDGKQIAEVAHFIERNKDNRVILVTDIAGNYRIEVIPVGKEKQLGKYKLTLEEIRDAAPQDQFIMKGQQTLLEAEKLHAKGSAESRKEAVAKYEEALEYWQKSGDLPGQADTNSYLAVVLFSTGNLPKALEKTLQARDFYNKAGDYLSEATAYRGIGLIHHIMGELDEALEFYEKGLDINRRLQNYSGEADDLGNIGGVYQFRGEYQKAIDHYRSALELMRKLPNENNDARLLNNIGEVYRLLGENQKALDYLKEALKLRNANGDRRGQGITLNNIGLVYLALEDYPSAVEHFTLSLNVRREIGDIQGESTTLNNLGFVELKIGDYAKALENLNQSLVLRRKSSNRRNEASTLYNLGRVYAALNDLDKAADYYQQALALSKEVKYLQTEAAVLKSLAEIELGKGNLDKADELMREAIRVIESLRSSVDIQSLRTSFLASKQSFYKSYIDLLMKKHEVNPQKRYDIEAFQISEKTHARSLVDLLSESRMQISKGVDAALLNRKKHLQLQINSKENRRAGFTERKGSEEKLESIEKDLTKLLEEYDEIKARIRLKSPKYAELTEPRTLDLDGIQGLLDKDSILLEFSLGEKQSYAWIIKNDSVKSYKLPKEQDITEASRRLYELMTARNHKLKNESTDELQKRIVESDKRIEKETLNLSKMIIQPFADQLDKERIIVVADGMLQYIPFSALSAFTKNTSSKKQTYQPLILKHEVVSLPSASTLAVLRERNSDEITVPGSVAVIADPVFSVSDSRVAESLARLKNTPQNQNAKLNINPDDSILGELKRSSDDLGINEFGRLRFSRREADDITSFTTEGKKLKAVDFSADRDWLMKEDLSKYRILHFATHALLNNKNPELSGIVLSLVDERGKTKDGFLRLHEIYNLRIGADLVVLSACQTALGKDVKGEGIIGLTRGFMYAGAESVVASLWKVEDRATAELMKKFYRAMLKDGQKPAAALRTAQMEMLKNDRWNNSYYWAAFTLQGDWK